MIKPSHIKNKTGKEEHLTPVTTNKGVLMWNYIRKINSHFMGRQSIRQAQKGTSMTFIVPSFSMPNRINSVYGELPEEARDAIDKRDGKA